MDGVQKLLAAREFAAAEAAATALLAGAPRSAPLLLARSTARARAGDAAGAVAAADAAAAAAGDAAVLARAQLRRTIAYYRAGDVPAAKAALRFATARRAALAKTEAAELDMWQARLADLPDAPSDLPEVPAGVPAGAPAEAAAETPAPAPRHDSYESDGRLILTVYARGVPDDATITVERRRLAIEHAGLAFALPLPTAVDPAASTWEVTPYKVEFQLAKALDAEGAEAAAAAPEAAAPAAAPVTQPAAKPAGPHRAAFEKNWDNIDVSDEEDAADPQAFFRSIYKNADPDAQRAMLKSYTESGGTTLSTNWAEVGKARVEPKPPSDFKLNQ